MSLNRIGRGNDAIPPLYERVVFSVDQAAQTEPKSGNSVGLFLSAGWDAPLSSAFCIASLCSAQVSSQLRQSMSFFALPRSLHCDTFPSTEKSQRLLL